MSVLPLDLRKSLVFLSPAERVRLYRAWGWCLIPVAPGTKEPIWKWGEFQTRHPTPAEWKKIERHAAEGKPVALMLGAISGVVVLDLDSPEAAEFWGGALAEHWGALPRATTPTADHRCHVYFNPNGRSGHVDGEGWELRGDKHIALLPLGGEREWRVAPPDGVLPDLGPVETLLGRAPQTTNGTRPDTATTASEPSVGGLAALLANPPGEGGRNVWLAKVAGHYARALPDFASYSLHVWQAAAPLKPPLPEDEVAKLLPSIWSAEDRKFERAVGEREFSLRVTDEAKARLRAIQFQPPEVAESFADLLARPLPEVVWAVEHLLGVGQNALLASQFKAGKTVLLLNLVRALVDGEPFVGRFQTCLGARVCWLNYELTGLTAQQWLRALGFERADRADIVGLRGERNPLASDAGREWLVRFLTERDVGFLVVDTFRGAYVGVGDSHNDNAQVGRFTALLDQIKQEAGVSGLALSHHFGRKKHEPGEEHGQGAVELDNWADTRWLLTRDGADRFLHVEGRDGWLEESRLSFDPPTRRLWLPDDDLGVARSEARESRARDALILAVRSEPGLNARGVRERARGGGGVATADLDAALPKLVEEGRICVVRGAGNSKLHYLPADVPAQTSLEVGE